MSASQDGASAAFGSLQEPTLCVLIPTYRRSDVLADVLRKYEVQYRENPTFCLVVVDDGSGDGTRGVLEAFAAKTPMAFRYQSLDQNIGPAGARNKALQLVKGEIVLITGDDILPSDTFVADHIKWHSSHSSREDAVLGYVTWPSDLDATPFMQWLESGGRQYFFNYADLPRDRSIGGESFYTCNVSVKKALLDGEKFDEGFRYASHEDLELGHRLQKKGMRLFYDPSICGYHWHKLEIAKIAKRVYVMGYSASVYWGKVEDYSSSFRRRLRSILKLCMGVFILLPLWKSARAMSSDIKSPFSWRILLFVSYWLGLRDAEKGAPLRELV